MTTLFLFGLLFGFMYIGMPIAIALGLSYSFVIAVFVYLFPIAVRLGIDPIHLGIIMVVNMEIGMVTPPVGLNLFVSAGITGMSLTEVLKAALPWMILLVAFLLLITFVAPISTWLPALLFGPETVDLGA